MKKKEFIYLIAIFILDVISLTDISRIINIDGFFRNIIYLFSLLIFVFKIFQTTYSKKNFIFLIVWGLISLFISFKLSDYMFLMNFLVMISIVDMDINKIIKVDLIVKLIFLVIHSIVYFYDLIFNYTQIESYLIYTLAFGARHSIYFSHPNTAAAIVIWLVIDWIYISNNKKISIILGSILVAVYSFFTISRTSLIIYCLFLMIIILLKYNIYTRILSFFRKYLFLIMVILNLLIVVFNGIMDNQFVIMLDKVLSKRLYYTNLAMDTFGFHFFPNNISLGLESSSIIVDNFYIRSFVSYGFIILIIIGVFYYICNKKEYNYNYFDQAILIIFPLYLFTELFPFNIGRSISLLIIANIIFNRKINKLNNNVK